MALATRPRVSPVILVPVDRSKTYYGYERMIAAVCLSGVNVKNKHIGRALREQHTGSYFNIVQYLGVDLMKKSSFQRPFQRYKDIKNFIKVSLFFRSNETRSVFL